MLETSTSFVPQTSSNNSSTRGNITGSSRTNLQEGRNNPRPRLLLTREQIRAARLYINYAYTYRVDPYTRIPVDPRQYEIYRNNILYNN